MSRKLLIAGSALVFAGAATTGVLLLSGGDGDSRSSPRANEQVLSVERAEEISTLLASGDEVVVRKALALPKEQTLDGAFVENLAALDLRVQQDTFTLTGQDEGTVEATTTTDGVTRVWTARLSRVDGIWLVVSTAPKADS